MKEITVALTVLYCLAVVAIFIAVPLGIVMWRAALWGMR